MIMLDRSLLTDTVICRPRAGDYRTHTILKDGGKFTVSEKRLIVVLTCCNCVFMALLIVNFTYAILHDSDFLKQSPGSFPEFAVMMSLFYIVLVMPVAAAVALVKNRAVRSMPAFWINGIMLILWLAVFMFSIITCLVR